MRRCSAPFTCSQFFKLINAVQTNGSENESGRVIKLPLSFGLKLPALSNSFNLLKIRINGSSMSCSRSASNSHALSKSLKSRELSLSFGLDSHALSLTLIRSQTEKDRTLFNSCSRLALALKLVSYCLKTFATDCYLCALQAPLCQA